MILFDLDGCLTDCSHRKYLIAPSYNPDYNLYYQNEKGRNLPKGEFRHIQTGKKFIPDWQAFYEACSDDKPISETIKIMRKLALYEEIQIWSGRCESVREKTINWFMKHIPMFAPESWFKDNLKMRPIGDSTPDDQLKERWLDEYLNKDGYAKFLVTGECPIEMVFDDRLKVLRMFQRRDIFTFDVGQGRGEF